MVIFPWGDGCLPGLMASQDYRRFEKYRNKPIPCREDSGGSRRQHTGLVQPFPFKEQTMKTWIKRSLITLFGVTLLAGGLTACGHRMHSPMSDEKVAEFRAKMIDRASKELELNEAQKAKLGVLADKLREQRLALMGTGEPRAQVQALVAGAQFDKAKAQVLVEEKTAALRTKSPEVIAAMADFFDSLNPTQQQKVRDLMQRRKGWWHRG
jgi:Spy/CpxP family protein refolding chaperone